MCLCCVLQAKDAAAHPEEVLKRAREQVDAAAESFIEASRQAEEQVRGVLSSLSRFTIYAWSGLLTPSHEFVRAYIARAYSPRLILCSCSPGEEGSNSDRGEAPRCSPRGMRLRRLRLSSSSLSAESRVRLVGYSLAIAPSAFETRARLAHLFCLSLCRHGREQASSLVEHWHPPPDSAFNVDELWQRMCITAVGLVR